MGRAAREVTATVRSPRSPGRTPDLQYGVLLLVVGVDLPAVAEVDRRHTIGCQVHRGGVIVRVESTDPGAHRIQLAAVAEVRRGDTG